MAIGPLVSSFSNLTLSSPALPTTQRERGDKRDFEKLVALGVIDQTGQVQPDYLHKRPCYISQLCLANLTQFLDQSLGQVSLRTLIASAYDMIKAFDERLIDLLFVGDELYKLLGYDFVVTNLINLVGDAEPLDQLFTQECIGKFRSECQAPIKTLSIRFVLPSSFQDCNRRNLVLGLQEKLSGLAGAQSVSTVSSYTGFNFALKTSEMTLWFVFTRQPVNDVFTTSDCLKLSVPIRYISGTHIDTFNLYDSNQGAQWLIDTFFKTLRIPNLHPHLHFSKIIRSLLQGYTVAPDITHAIVSEPKLVDLWNQMCSGQLNPAYRDDHLQSILQVSQILAEASLDPMPFITETLAIYERFFYPIANEDSFFTISCRLIRDKKCSFDEWLAVTALFLLIQPSYGRFSYTSQGTVLEMIVGTNRYLIPFNLDRILHFSKTALPKLLQDPDFDRFVECFSHPQLRENYTFMLPPNFERDLETSLPVHYLILVALNPTNPLVITHFARASAFYSASLKSLLLKKNLGSHSPTSESLELQWIKLLLQLPNQMQKLQGVQLLAALKGYIDEKKALMPQVISISQSHAEKLFLQVNPTEDEMRAWLRGCDINRALHSLVTTNWMPLCVETDLKACLEALPVVKKGKIELAKQIVTTLSARGETACLDSIDSQNALLLLQACSDIRIRKLPDLNLPQIMIRAGVANGTAHLDHNIFLNLLWAMSNVNEPSEDTAKWFLLLLQNNKVHVKIQPAFQMQLFVQLCQRFSGLITKSLKSYIDDLYARLTPDERKSFVPAITALVSQNAIFSTLFNMYAVDPAGKCTSYIQKKDYIEAAKLLLEYRDLKVFSERVLDGLLKMKSDDNGRVIFELLLLYYPSDTKVWGKVFTKLDENLKITTLQVLVEHFFDHLRTSPEVVSKNQLFYKLITTRILSNPQWLSLNSYNCVEWIRTIFTPEQLSGEPMQEKLLVIFDQLIKKLEQDHTKRAVFAECAHKWYRLLILSNIDLEFRLFALIHENCSQDLFQQTAALIPALLPHLRQTVKPKSIKSRAASGLLNLRVTKTTLSTYFKAAVRYDPQYDPNNVMNPNTYHLVDALLNYENEELSYFLLSELIDHPHTMVRESFIELVDAAIKMPNVSPERVDVISRMLEKLLTHSKLSTCQLLYQLVFNLPYKSPLFCNTEELIYCSLMRPQNLTKPFKGHLPIYAVLAKHYVSMIEKSMKSTNPAEAKIALEIDLCISVHAASSIDHLMHASMPDQQKIRIMLFLKYLELDGWNPDMKQLYIALLRTRILSLSTSSAPAATTFSFLTPIYRLHSSRSYEYDNALMKELLEGRIPKHDVFQIISRYPSTLSVYKRAISEDASSAPFVNGYFDFLHKLILHTCERTKNSVSPVILLDFSAQLLRNKIEQNPRDDKLFEELDAHIMCYEKRGKSFENHRRISLNLLRLAQQHQVFDLSHPKLADWLSYLSSDSKAFTEKNLSSLRVVLSEATQVQDSNRATLKIFGLQDMLLTWQESNFIDEFDERHEALKGIFNLWKQYPECVHESTIVDQIQTIFIPNTTLFGVKGPHREAVWRANQLFFDSCFEIYDQAADLKIRLQALNIICSHLKNTKECEGFYDNDKQFIEIVKRLIPIFTNKRNLPLEELKPILETLSDALCSRMYENTPVDRIILIDILLNRLIETAEQEDQQWIIEVAIKWIFDSGVLLQCRQENESNIISFAHIIILSSTNKKTVNMQMFFELIGKLSFMRSQAAAKNLIAQLPQAFKDFGQRYLEISD